MKWIDLVPGEFERLAREEKLCVVPMGSLERHGEHLPFGCDVVVAERVAELAAEITPAVVFPGYFLGQVHESSCFTGTVNLPQAMAVEVLSRVLNGIAQNGFTKIAIVSAHGGNEQFLDYFAMSQLDEPRDYTLYLVNAYTAMNRDEKAVFTALWETQPLGHACEMETSVYMACRPGKVRLNLTPDAPVQSQRRTDHLRANGVRSGLWWYAEYPENVVGDPRAATQEKGEQALGLMVSSVARALQVIKDDETAPALRQEFLCRVREKGK